MQRRAFLGGAAALAVTPFVGSSFRALAHDATPEASPAAAPVLPVTYTDDSGAEVREYRRGDFFQSTSPLRDVHHRVVKQDLVNCGAEK